jgi:peptide/nickel transport system substrate-binding protein
MMRRSRTIALAFASMLAMVGLAACSESPNANKATSVLNIGMPNGPQTENNNPFL